MKILDVKTIHPPILKAKFLRSLRILRSVPGWGRIVNALIPLNSAGKFVVVNNGVAFSGDIGSYIDRQVYLFGDYEEQCIDQFISLVPQNRRHLILDVGANVGTHSLSFARLFDKVHAFEPNPMLWPAFEQNMGLNDLRNVSLHKVGLGAKDESLTLFLTEKTNFGLGTFATFDQYDVPLKASATCKVVIGDDFLEAMGISDCDAIKIDVQGFEPEAIAGLRRTIERNRPIIWFELGAGTHSKLKTLAAVQALFSYPIQLHRVGMAEPLNESGRDAELPTADYIVIPK